MSQAGHLNAPFQGSFPVLRMFGVGRAKTRAARKPFRGDCRDWLKTTHFLANCFFEPAPCAMLKACIQDFRAILTVGNIVQLELWDCNEQSECFVNLFRLLPANLSNLARFRAEHCAIWRARSFTFRRITSAICAPVGELDFDFC